MASPTTCSLSSTDDNTIVETTSTKEEEQRPIRSAKEALLELIQKVEVDEVRRAMRIEVKRLLTDHERLVTMLQQRSEILEHENNELKIVSSESQRRYEKAVREMQFFRRKYDNAMELNKQYLCQQQQRPRSLSIDSTSSDELDRHPPLLEQRHKHQSQHLHNYPLTPTSPQPTCLPAAAAAAAIDPDVPFEHVDYGRQKTASMPSRSSSTSTSSSSANSIGQYWPGTPMATPCSDPTTPPVPRRRQNSNATSVHSAQSTSTDRNKDGKAPRRKSSWQSSLQPQQQGSANGSSSQQQNIDSSSTNPPPVATSSTATATSSRSAPPAVVHSVAMTPVRSSTATNGYTGASLIQQRRVDPLIFGGSDGLWETIAKSKGSDVTVEKIISNFLRRGGSPNTAKQSASVNAVKYGYGMIHALIVTKAPGSLDLLLQQGANPNVMTLSQVEDDKVTPCYLAASVGWLTGLQKLVQAGGDLMAARGAGVKNKTALHVAAEHCHAAVVEYIVGVTQGGLNLEEDSDGATVLHYACASGHTDLVSFLARSCQIPVNQPDHRGELPLHWAARHGRLEVVTLLVERCGCDFNAYVPRKVGTPLDLAKANGHKRLVDYLKGLGALTAKKADKRREEELAKGHLESTLAKNGFS